MQGDVSWIKRPRSMESLLPPNYECDNGRFELGLPHIRPAWLKDESIKSLDSKFPMVPAPEGTIVLYTTPLGEKLWKNPRTKEFDLTDPLRPSLSYNYLHDEHLKYYFRSDDLKKRLKDEGFITDHGFVKCTLKEFNEYRQWIRNLKLRELYRERKIEKKLVEEARKERLDCLALERDVELQEIMKKRRERRQKDNEIRKKMIEKEKKREQKLAQIDNKRREQIIKIKTNNKERLLKRREVERMKRRKSKDKQERKEYKIKLRITTKMDFQSDDRLRKLQEKKDEIMQEKAKTIEDQWYRRKSWSCEYHEEQKRSRVLNEQKFHEHVHERNVKVSRQRRHSEVCYEEIANANRLVFETQLQNAEVFMAKLNEKRTRELDKWKKHFNEMKPSSATSSVPSMKSTSLIEKPKKRGQRRRSTWDLESCLLRDLGMNETEIAENAYSKLGVITRGVPVVQEPEFSEKRGKLEALEEIDEHLEGDNKEDLEERHFAIPMIVESLASVHTRSSSAQSKSPESLSETGKNIEDKAMIKQSPSKIRGSIHNIGMSQDELRHAISKYVENILYHSSEVLGIKIKFPERTKLTKRRLQLEAYGGSGMVAETKDDKELRRQIVEYVENIVRRASEIAGVKIKLPDRNQVKVRAATPVKDTKALKTPKVETVKSMTSTRIKVKELLSSILDNAEKSAGVIIKRPPEYEQIKKQLEKKQETIVVETPVVKLVDSKQKYANARTMAKHLIVNMMQSVAKQMNIIIKLPPEYQSFCKPNENKMVVSTTNIMNPISIGNKILKVEDELDKERAERLRHENLIMVASQVVLDALGQAVLLARAQKRNDAFFMEGEQEIVASLPQRAKEITARMKIEKCEELKKKSDNVKEKRVPREIDFLSKFETSCGSDPHDITKLSQSFLTSKSSEEKSPTELDKKHRIKVGESVSDGTGNKSKPSKDVKKPGDKFGDDGKVLNVKTQGTIPSSGRNDLTRKSGKQSRDTVKPGESKEDKSSQGQKKELRGAAGGNVAGKGISVSKTKEEQQSKVKKTPGTNIAAGKGTEDKKELLADKRPGNKKSRITITKPEERLKSAAKTKETGEKVSITPTKKSGETTTKKPGNEIMNFGRNEHEEKIKDASKETENITRKKAGDKVMSVDLNQPGNKTSIVSQEDAQKGTNDVTKEFGENVLTKITKEPKEKPSSITIDDSNAAKKTGEQVINTTTKEQDSKDPTDTIEEPGDKITSDVTEKPTDEKVGVKSKGKVKATETKKMSGVKKATKPSSNATKTSEDKIENDDSGETGNEKPNAVKPKEKAVDGVEPEGIVQVSEKLENKLPKPSKTKKETGTRNVDNDVKKTPVREGAQSIMEPEKEDNKKKGNPNVKEKIVKHDDQKVDKEIPGKKESKEKAIVFATGSSSESPGSMGNVESLGSSGLDIKSPSFPKISPTSESFTFGLKSVARPGAITPSRETSPNQERLAVGSKSSVILRMISMREQQEQCNLSPHSSYVVLPQLSSSESAFISGKMQSVQKDNGQNTEGVKSPTVNRSPVPTGEVIQNSTVDDQIESVKLPRVSSPDISQLPPRSPTPTRCTSRSSIVSLPHIGASNISLIGSNEITSTSTNNKPEKKVNETMQSSSKTIISSQKKSSDASSQKSENQNKKSEHRNKKSVNISGKNAPVTGQAKEDQVPGAKRRDSKSRSSTTVISTRRPSVKSHQEMSVFRTDSIHGRTKRGSISKSMGVAVVPGAKKSHGEETQGIKSLSSSKTEIRRGSIGSEKKSKTSSTHLVRKEKGRRHSKISTNKIQHPDNFEGRKTEDPTAKEDASQGKDCTRTGENEKVLSSVSNKEKPLTNTENKFLPSVPTGERDFTENITKVGNDALSDGEVKTNLSNTELTDRLSKKDSSHDPNNHKNINGQNDQVVNAASTKTKSKTDSKLKEPNKIDDDKQLSKAKTSSRTPMPKQSSEKTKNVSNKVSEKSEHALKRNSNSRVRIQESKHGTRKMSIVDSKKLSEKNMRKRSSTVSGIVKSKTSKTKTTGSTHSRKDGNLGKSAEKFEKDQVTKSTSSAHAQSNATIDSMTNSQDAILADVPGKADSDTEVVMQVYVADSPHQPEGSDKVSAEKPETKQEGGSAKTGNKTTDKDKKKAKGTIKKKNKDGLLVVGSSPKSSPTREDLLKNSSSRKAFGDNPQERNLVSILPRNSLDILKVTKISTQLGQGIQGNQTIQPPQTKITPSRTKVDPKTPVSRNYRKPGVEDQGSKTTKLGIMGEGVVGLSSTSLGLKGEGLSVKSSKVLKTHPSMQRVSSKISSNLERVEETPSLESPTEGPKKEPQSPSRSQGPSDETLTEALAVNKVGVTKHSSLENKKSDSHKEIIKKESPENVSKSSIPKNVSINSTSFSDIVQGTPLLGKDSGKSTASKTSSPQSSVASHGHLIPTPPITSKPVVVSPKISRVKRTISNGSSGRSRGSLASNEMSPTASLEIVKLSSQGSHGWVSSPTSSVKFLPPIEARASKSSNNSDDSQRQRPRTAESGTSRAESSNSRGATIVEIRRSNSGTTRVDGKTSGLIAVKSSSSGGSAKQTVIGV